jgi:hypothetical protein
MGNIYLCKPISEVGAEQMLLDVHAMKTILLDIPNMGASIEEKGSASAAYTKFVIKGISKVETLLKVVLTPLEPPEMIVKNYLILFSDISDQVPSSSKLGESKDGFIKMLDLKGVKKSDQQALVDILVSRITNVPCPSPLLQSAPKEMNAANYSNSVSASTAGNFKKILDMKTSAFKWS